MSLRVQTSLCTPAAIMEVQRNVKGSCAGPFSGQFVGASNVECNKKLFGM